MVSSEPVVLYFAVFFSSKEVNISLCRSIYIEADDFTFFPQTPQSRLSGCVRPVLRTSTGLYLLSKASDPDLLKENNGYDTDTSTL